MSTTYTDYDILVALEDIFKADYRTKNQTVQSCEDPDDVPHAEACPVINIFPMNKPRVLTRVGSSKPYINTMGFEIVLWEVSMKDYKDAYRLMVDLEEDVYKVLLDNKTIDDKAQTSVVGETVYEFAQYEYSNYIRATMSLEVQTNR